MNVMFAFLGWPEIVAILAVVLLLFGAKKLPELAKGLGSGIKEFKKASREVQDEIDRSVQDEEPARKPAPPAQPTQSQSNPPPSGNA
jgi:sec-independent protein translocase protein TatA